MNIPQITQMPVINSNHKSTTNTLFTLLRKGTQGSSHQGLATTTLTTQASPIARRSLGTDESKRVFKPLASPDDQPAFSAPKQVFCSYHKTKTHNLDECQKFRDLDFKEQRNSCSKTDSVLIVPTQTNIYAKYVETETLQSFMIRQGQKTRSLQLLQPALNYAKKDQSVRVPELSC